MAPRTKPTALAELVEDMAVYPRHAVDDVHVGQLAESIKAGASPPPPPPIAEAGSKRLVDGWHRVRAYRKVLGATGVIDVEYRAYKSEADLILDAIALNANHGRKLDRVDQVRSVLLAQEAGATNERIALALRVTPERLGTLQIRVALVAVPSQDNGHAGDQPRTMKVPLKRSMIHLAGKELTQEQWGAHDSQAGTSFLLQAHQLRDALKYDLMNRADDRLMAALRELQAEIGRYLEALTGAV